MAGGVASAVMIFTGMTPMMIMNVFFIFSLTACSGPADPPSVAPARPVPPDRSIQSGKSQKIPPHRTLGHMVTDGWMRRRRTCRRRIGGVTLTCIILSVHYRVRSRQGEKGISVSSPSSAQAYSSPAQTASIFPFLPKWQGEKGISIGLSLHSSTCSPCVLVGAAWQP